jgi:hypothetical protein
MVVGAVVNAAPTLRSWFIVSTQGIVPAQSPDQPVNVEVGAGVAVRVTTVSSV